jgi:prepilin-type N-terminal cleavage/methylation domain-containing protein
MKASRHAGFTLMELLVVIATMGIVATVALSAFFGMTASWREVSSRAALDRQAEAAFELIRADLADLVSPALAGTSLKVVNKTHSSRDEYVAAPTRDDDELTFPVLLEAADGSRVPGLITYFVSHEDDPATPEDEGNTLKRLQADLAGNYIGSSRAAEARALWFSVEFATPDGRWAPEWTEPQPTTAVRVSLTLQDPDTGEQVIRQAVLPVFAN